MRTWISGCLWVCTIGAAGPASPAEDDVLRAELRRPATGLAAQAEALTQDDVTQIFETALANVGCALPVDLVSVFDIYLVDQAMAYLGQPVGAEVAQQGFFALRLRSEVIGHDEARAVLAAARAMDGVLAERLRTGRMPMVRGLFDDPECGPTGTLFTLAPYAAR